MRGSSYTACQLCDHTKARDGVTVPLAVTVVAGVRLCAAHVERLIAIASENGIPVTNYLPQRAA